MKWRSEVICIKYEEKVAASRLKAYLSCLEYSLRCRMLSDACRVQTIVESALVQLVTQMYWISTRTRRMHIACWKLFRSAKRSAAASNFVWVCVWNPGNSIDNCGSGEWWTKHLNIIFQLQPWSSSRTTRKHASVAREAQTERKMRQTSERWQCIHSINTRCEMFGEGGREQNFKLLVTCVGSVHSRSAT